MVSSLQLSKMAQLATLAQQAENEMQYVGIFPPNYGLKEDMPVISLADVFTVENENILLRYGQIERARMRLPEFLEKSFATGTITATNGSKIITASAGAGTWASSATHKPYWTDRKVSITDGGITVDYTIDTINDAGSQITLTVNYTGTGGAGLAYSIGTVAKHVQIPDGNPVIRYHRLIKTSGVAQLEYILGFTKANIYLWSTSWSAWILKFGPTDCEQWDTQSVNEQVIATNNIDYVICWGTTTGDLFANLGGDANGLFLGGTSYLTAAKYIEVFESYVILGFVTIDGQVYPCVKIWSTNGDETDWDQTGAGDAGMANTEEGGFITGLKTWGHRLIIGKQKQLRVTWLVTGEDVFNEDKLAEQGNLAAHSMIIDGEGRFYWLASDYTIRCMSDGSAITGSIDVTMKQINPAYQKFAEAFYVAPYGILLFSLPIGNQATGNNQVIWFDSKEGKWGKWNMAIAAFGNWTRQEVYTWSSLPFARWGEWGWDRWSGVENKVGFALDLCSDYDGYSYDLHAAEKDNADDYTGSFVLSTDLLERVLTKRFGTTLRQFKRLESIQLLMKEESSGTFEIDIKRDNRKAWESAGSVSLEYDAELDEGQERDIIERQITPDMRAKHFLIKGSASNKFEFIGMILGFLVSGTR